MVAACTCAEVSVGASRVPLAVSVRVIAFVEGPAYGASASASFALRDVSGAPEGRGGACSDHQACDQPHVSAGVFILHQLLENGLFKGKFGL